MEEFLDAVDRAGYPDGHPYAHRGVDWSVKEARSLAGEP